jgi:glycerol-3-phosphate dehydrogenase (NAD+)
MDYWYNAAGVPLENILYLGGPNIASEIYNKEYANARICGADKWRKPLAKFLRQPHFIVWDNSDLITHEVMGGLKNVYAIGAGNFYLSFSLFPFFFLEHVGELCISLY